MWCRRNALFAKKVPFAVDETTLDFSNVHLVCTRHSLESAVFGNVSVYVHETHAFATVAAEINILDGARWRDALPQISVWCKRDIIFSKTLAFGVDETTLAFSNVHSV